MSDKYIDAKNFDRHFKKLLKIKAGNNVVKGRFDMEAIVLDAKSDFIIQLLLSFKNILGITYKILFWEKDERIEALIKEKFYDKNYQITVSYKNGKLPGAVYVEDRIIDKNFLKEALNNHFNYEMAKDPALNIRVQICVNQVDFVILLDIYDDRGFDIYYLRTH